MMRQRKNITPILAAILLLILPLLLSGCCPPFYLRQVNFRYLINIEAKPGERPVDVTVMIPFPVHDGQPVEQVLQDLRDYYARYGKDDTPDVAFSIKKTPYGKMLRIHIPRLGGVGLVADRSINSLFTNRPERDRYPLSGLNLIKTKRVNPSDDLPYYLRIYDAHVYVSYKNATGIIYRNRYGTDHQEPGYPTFGGTGGGGVIKIGTDEYVLGNALYEVSLDKQGWIKLPACGTGGYIDEN
jgi:hypothetical protein